MTEAGALEFFARCAVVDDQIAVSQTPKSAQACHQVCEPKPVGVVYNTAKQVLARRN
jgi:hypothetical protein